MALLSNIASPLFSLRNTEVSSQLFNDAGRMILFPLLAKYMGLCPLAMGLARQDLLQFLGELSRTFGWSGKGIKGLSTQ